MNDPNPPLRFRSWLLYSFLGFCAAFIGITAALMNGAAGAAGDLVLQQQLQYLLEEGGHGPHGMFVGKLDDLPPDIAALVKNAPLGYSEIEEYASEHQVVRVAENGQDRYAVISVPEAPEIPGFSVFLLASLAAIGLAWLLALWLARRLSRPIEALIQLLRENRPLPAGPSDTFEVAVLSQAIVDFREEQVSRAEREANFARSVSHELRTPLTVLQGVLDLINRDQLDEVDLARTVRVERAVANMSNTVASLLHLYRSEQTLAAQDVPAEVLLRDSIDQLAETSDTQVQLDVVNMPGRSPTLVVVALQILVGNALSHANASTVRIDVDRDCVVVTDDGAGLPQDVRDAIATDTLGRGHLGYTILNRICERAGWRYDIEDANPGTRVVLKLG